ncbi:MAG: NADPH-dependent FMN reductase [Solirubrobacteraceae bacterium]
MSPQADQTLAVLAVDASPSAGGRTRSALDAVAGAGAAAGATVETITLGADGAGIGSAIDALASADAVVLASPVYRASSAAPLKQLLDAIPREGSVAPHSPLTGKAVAIVHTGASLHHFLAPDSLRSVLAGFFAAYVLPPGLYVPREGFDDALALREPYAGHARLQGEGLVALAHALAHSPVLRSLRPQA